MRVSFRLCFQFALVTDGIFFVALADADPLGVNTNVTFDEVGGLDDRKLAHLLILYIMKPNVFFRHPFIERDDPPPPLIPRSLPAIQCHPSSRSALSRSPRNRKDVSSQSPCGELQIRW
jgi:hypothetical protein